MTTIAILTKNDEGNLVGTLLTLTLTSKISFMPETSENDKAPAYRVYAGNNEVEIGAGWKKTAKSGKAYVSVKLDDPTFAQPIYCVLLKTEDGYRLDWNRQTPKRSKQTSDEQNGEF